MTQAASVEPADRAASVVESMRLKGVRLWLEKGELRYKAPKGALTPQDVERLRASLGQVVRLLEHSGGREWAPLTHSQVAHWRESQLGARPGIRQVAAAMRLRGRVDFGLLRRCIEEVERRHTALRTQIVLSGDGGLPAQRVSESPRIELGLDDLTGLTRGELELRLRHLLRETILEPVRVAVDPLWAVRIMTLGRDEHVLIVAMEHLISDGVSLGILQRDLLTVYQQAAGGRVLSLPAIPCQFVDYAASQSESHPAWIAKQGAYWDGHLAGCHRLRFPSDLVASSANCPGWGKVPIRLDCRLRNALSEWSFRHRTTLVMTVFTAYVALVLRWCDSSCGVIRYQTDGRTHPKVRHTIGYFASALHLKIELRPDDRFVDLLHRVTGEYCSAFEYFDSGYVEAQVPRPAYVANTRFNWVPGAPGRSDPETSAGELSAARFSFENPALETFEIDGEPSVLLYDLDEGIVGDVRFPANRFSSGLMGRFTGNFRVFVQSLLCDPERRIRDIPVG